MLSTVIFFVYGYVDPRDLHVRTHSCPTRLSSDLKSAVLAMTKVAALEYVGQGLRVNTIVPGGMKTPMQANVTPEQVEWYKAQIPMGDLGEPNDIAYGALYLLSDEAKYVTGTELFIDGGWSSAA